MSEQLHVKGMPDTTTCEIHDWPTEGLARRLVAAMRERHGKGGINACVPCIERAKAGLGPPERFVKGAQGPERRQ